MRNLKRVLSLALATAMLFSMMVIGASAANKTLTDLDKVVNKEAVNLMVDLGIIVGKPDGSYAPTETIDRATMSKLIYFIMMGNTDESAFKGVSTPLTDVKGNWAEGFINYCYSVNFVAGTGNNTYNPNGKVTTVSAAKMLLVALGYDPVASKYQNDVLWSVNIMRDAQTAGLLKNIDQKASEELTRDNAAQLIYNALFAATVKPDFQIDMGIKYLKGYDKVMDGAAVVTLGKANYNLTKYTGVVVANEFAALNGAVQDTGKTKVAAYDNGAVDFADAETLKTATDVALLGQEVNYYTYTSKNTLSSFVAATGKTKEYTWTDSDITYTKFLTNNSLDTTGAEWSVNYVDGNAFTPDVKDGTRFVDSNANGDVDFVLKANYTFSKVTKVDSTNVTITGLGTRKIADVSGSAKLEKGDYVNYAPVGTSGKATAEKAVEVEGTITALKSSKTKAVINGTTYTVAADAGKASVASPDQVANTYVGALTISKAGAGIFYLNRAGELAVFSPTEDVADTTVKYAYVTALKVSTDAWDGTKTVEAKVVLADGTQKTLTVVDNDKDDDTSGLFDAAIDNKDDAVELVYPYTLNSKDQMVAGLEVTDVEDVRTGSSYVAGKPEMLLANSKKILLNDSTVVLFYDKDEDDKETIKSYTGVDNVPGIASGTSVTYVIKDGFASYILVKAVGEVQTAEYAYALSDTYTSETSKGYEYSMSVNGEKVTLTTDDEMEDMKVGKIYTYGVDKDGIATLSGVSSDVIASGVVTSVTSKYITLKGGAVITLASEYSVDDLTATDSKSNIIPGVGDISKDDNIIYVLSADKLVKAYVINVGAPAGENEFDDAADAADIINKGVSFAVDGTSVAVSGTLVANTGSDDLDALWGTDTDDMYFIGVKFTAPAGIVADADRKLTIAKFGAEAAPTASNGVLSGENVVELILDVTAGEDAEDQTIEITIQWTADYSEVYTIDLSSMTWAPIV